MKMIVWYIGITSPLWILGGLGAVAYYYAHKVTAGVLWGIVAAMLILTVLF